MALLHCTHDQKLSVRLPAELRQAADRAARELGWSTSDFIRECIRVAAMESTDPTPETPRRTASRRRPGT